MSTRANRQRAQQLALLREDVALPWDLRRLDAPVLRTAIAAGPVALPDPTSLTRVPGRGIRNAGQTVLSLDVDTDPAFVVPVAARAWEFMERHQLPWQERATSVLIDVGDVGRGQAQRAPRWHVDFQPTTGRPYFQFLVGSALPTVVAREAPPGNAWRANDTISNSVEEWQDWHPKEITRLRAGTLYCTTGYTVHRGARAPRPLRRIFGGIVFPDNEASSGIFAVTDKPAFTYDVLTGSLTDHRTPLLRSLLRIVRATSTPFAQVVDVDSGRVLTQYHRPADILGDSPGARVMASLRAQAIESLRTVRVNGIGTEMKRGTLSGVSITPLVADGRVLATIEMVSDRTVEQFEPTDTRHVRQGVPAVLKALAFTPRDGLA